VFGGPCNTPVAERLAASGVKLNRFHTTALCSPTRQAMLTGRNHHSVAMGGITEIATSAPGYSGLRPKDKAPIAETLRLNGYSTSGLGRCHEVPVWEVSDYGPHGSKFTGVIDRVVIDIGKDSHDHLVTAEDKLNISMARQ
jgi:arylsulfatase A-like enzyme